MLQYLQLIQMFTNMDKARLLVYTIPAKAAQEGADFELKLAIVQIDV